MCGPPLHSSKLPTTCSTRDKDTASKLCKNRNLIPPSPRALCPLQYHRTLSSSDSEEEESEMGSVLSLDMIDFASNSSSTLTTIEDESVRLRVCVCHCVWVGGCGCGRRGMGEYKFECSSLSHTNVAAHSPTHPSTQACDIVHLRALRVQTASTLSKNHSPDSIS